MKIFRSDVRWVLIISMLTALMSALLQPVLAQTATFPTKPVTIIVPYAAGSGPDVISRKLGQVLSRKWKQPVLIDNRPGGAGFIGIEAAKRAVPDGHTLLLLDSEHVSALPHLYKNRGYNTWDTFDPIATTYKTAFLVAVSSNSNIRSVPDLITAAKSADGRMTYGSWAVGGAGHLGGVLLEQLTGVRMEHVAYRDVGQLFISVANGDVPWGLATLASSRAAYETGRLRYVAVTATKRLPQLPNVPTVTESGGPPEFEVYSVGIVVAQKGIAESIRANLNEDFAMALSDPEVKATLDMFAFEPIAWSRSEILQQMRLKSDTYRALIQRNKIVLD